MLGLEMTTLKVAFSVPVTFARSMRWMPVVVSTAVEKEINSKLRTGGIRQIVMGTLFTAETANGKSSSRWTLSVIIPYKKGGTVNERDLLDATCARKLAKTS